MQKDCSPNLCISHSSSNKEVVALDAYARAKYYVFARVPYPDREDILTEVFIGIWESLSEGRFQGNSSFSTYTYTIVRRRVLDWMKRKQRERDMFAELPAYGLIYRDYSALDFEMKELVERFWGCLDIITNEKAKVCIQLYYKKGMTQAAIAKEVGISPRYVHGLINQTLRRMIKEFVIRSKS